MPEPGAPTMAASVNSAGEAFKSERRIKQTHDPLLLPECQKHSVSASLVLLFLLVATDS